MSTWRKESVGKSECCWLYVSIFFCFTSPFASSKSFLSDEKIADTKKLLTAFSLPPCLFADMERDAFGFVFPGYTAIFSGIAERLMLCKEDNERPRYMWYAAHPSTMLSVASHPSCTWDWSCRKFFRRADCKNTGINVYVETGWTDGVRIGNDRSRVTVSAAAAHMKIFSSVIKRPVNLYIESWDVYKFLDLFLSVQAESRDFPVLEVKYLETSSVDFLVNSHDRRRARNWESIPTMRARCDNDLSMFNAAMARINELKGLQMTMNGSPVSFLVSLGREVHRMFCVVELSRANITDNDIKVLSTLRQLRVLYIDNCYQVTTLAPFKDHPSLHTICASFCCRLRRVEALTTIPTLRDVTLDGENLDPDEISRCVRNFTGLERLTLSCPRIAEMPVVSMHEYPNLRWLSMLNVTFKSFQWITKAPYLRCLVLSGTTVTEEELTEVCRWLYYLEGLYVLRCKNLKTSLSFVLPMEHMREVFISKSSLVKNNVIYSLEERNIKILQLK